MGKREAMEAGGKKRIWNCRKREWRCEKNFVVCTSWWLYVKLDYYILAGSNVPDPVKSSAARKSFEQRLLLRYQTLEPVGLAEQASLVSEVNSIPRI